VLNKLWVLTRRELRSWLKSPFLSATFIIGPVIWIFVFGNAFNHAFFGSGTSIGTLDGAPDYFNFVATAMLVVMPMAFAGRTGASIFADRFKGYLDRLLVSPVRRETILLAKIFASLILGLVQTLILMAVTVPFGLDVSNVTLASFGALLLTVVLLSYGFSSVFLIVSMRIRRWPTQQLVGSIITTPIMFFSNAFYPQNRLPGLLGGLVSLNPLSYGIDAVRGLFFGDGTSTVKPVMLNLEVLVAFAAIASVVLFITSRKWL
jgi:ABC-2 type transport system permease protein